MRDKDQRWKEPVISEEAKEFANYRLTQWLFLEKYHKTESDLEKEQDEYLEHMLSIIEFQQQAQKEISDKQSFEADKKASLERLKSQYGSNNNSY